MAGIEDLLSKLGASGAAGLGGTGSGLFGGISGSKGPLDELVSSGGNVETPEGSSLLDDIMSGIRSLKGGEGEGQLGESGTKSLRGPTLTAGFGGDMASTDTDKTRASVANDKSGLFGTLGESINRDVMPLLQKGVEGVGGIIGGAGKNLLDALTDPENLKSTGGVGLEGFAQSGVADLGDAVNVSQGRGVAQRGFVSPTSLAQKDRVAKLLRDRESGNKELLKRLKQLEKNRVI